MQERLSNSVAGFIPFDYFDFTQYKSTFFDPFGYAQGRQGSGQANTRVF